MRPADAPCDEAGYYVDPLSMSFEVQTSLCDYLTVAQAISAPVYAGDRIAIAASHDTLVAPAPSQGYMGLALDGEIIWELDVPIPASAEVYMDELVLDRDIPAGAVLQLHVHNHGENTWELQSVRCLPPEDA